MEYNAKNTAIPLYNVVLDKLSSPNIHLLLPPGEYIYTIKDRSRKLILKNRL
jgi:hypothetical protein